MNETKVSRRGVLRSIFGGLAAFAGVRRAPKATSCAAAEPSFEPDMGATAYTYDEQARLLSVTIYEGGKATILAV